MYSIFFYFWQILKLPICVPKKSQIIYDFTFQILTIRIQNAINLQISRSTYIKRVWISCFFNSFNKVYTYIRGRSINSKELSFIFTSEMIFLEQNILVMNTFLILENLKYSVTSIYFFYTHIYIHQIGIMNPKKVKIRKI